MLWEIYTMLCKNMYSIRYDDKALYMNEAMYVHIYLCKPKGTIAYYLFEVKLLSFITFIRLDSECKIILPLLKDAVII